MKKIALVIAIIFGVSLYTYAQNRGLFGYGEVSQDEDYSTAWYINNQHQDYEDNGLFIRLRNSIPSLPNHGQNENQNAPLGGGALLLIGFGTAYTLKKRQKG